eukprot:212874_1
MKASILTLVLRLYSTDGFSTIGPKRESRSTLHLARGKIELPPNEFSRPLRTEVVLGPRRREYNIEISAKDEELDNLAKRFSLSKITKLDADLSLKRDRNSSSPGFECIQVRGTIVSEVIQTCVRTNEDFEVDLEFDFLSTVKSSGTKEEEDLELGGMSAAQIQGALGGGGGGGSKKGKRRRGGNDSRQNGATLDQMKMKELEGLLQEFDVEEDIVEDESIFGSNGLLDVGELVAQSFRLKLDPYPKKPGSEPVSYSITG